MILGVDHIALSCSDLADGVARLAHVGLAARFMEYGLQNPPEKRALLGRYTETHDMAWCRGDAGIAVELTRHGSAGDDVEAGYQVLFEGACREPAEGGATDAWSSTFERSCETTPRGGVSRLPLPGFRTSVYWMPGPASPRVRVVGIPAHDLSLTMRFWEKALGCVWEAPGGTDATTARGQLASPNPAWAQELVIRVCGRSGTPSLDQPGFPCLALLCSNLEADLDHACQFGPMLSTLPFSLEVGGKDLRIAMLRDPSGNIIELIQFKKGVS